MMNPVPYTDDAFRLLHEGALALAEVEEAGIAIDLDYIKRATAETNAKVRGMEERLESSPVVKAWRKHYRNKTNIDSPAQLAVVLYDVMGVPAPKKKTEGGKHATDEETLLEIEDEGIAAFVREYLPAKKLKKAVSTNLDGIARETVDGLLHSFFNLHGVVTYRSSSDSINFQNQPLRDPLLAALVRRAFVAREGRMLVEVDFSGAEVRVGAAYHQDPTLIEYLLDESTDMHRDTAAELFLADAANVSKPMRQEAKTNFVFAEFYGAWYIACTEHLWKFVCEDRNVTAAGVQIREHLRDQGVTEKGPCDPEQKPRPGTFEHVVWQTERKFWGERFKTYDQWKREFYTEYLSKGWFQTLTGFVCQGVMGKKDVCNYPIQGSSFHLLLWSLIRIVREELRKRNMESLVIGQIHDSMVADVVPCELDDFVALCRKVMVKLLARRFPWLVVPMKIEVGVCPVGGSWNDKKDFKID